MKISNLNLKKYKRFFAFGCSFTNYHWPTWADIIGREIPFYENWGRISAGNQFIFNSFIECDAKYHFSKDDLVIIMWTSVEREDRYLENDWLLASHLERSKIYGNSWVKKFGEDIRGLLIRDLAAVRACQQILISRDCDWANFSMAPISKMNCSEDDIKDLSHLNELHFRYVNLHKDLCNGKEITEPYAHSSDVLNSYREEFKNIKDSVLNVVFKGEWSVPPRPNKNNCHPSPGEHLKYLQNLYPDFKPSDETLKFIEHWDTIVWNLKDTDIPSQQFVNKVDRL